MIPHMELSDPLLKLGLKECLHQVCRLKDVGYEESALLGLPLALGTSRRVFLIVFIQISSLHSLSLSITLPGRHFLFLKFLLFI